MFDNFGGMFDPNSGGIPTTVRAGFRWRTRRGNDRQIECDIFQWNPPGSGTVVQQFIVIPCPACQHHMAVGLRQDAITVDAQQNLTLGAVLKCAAQWPKRDGNGQMLQERKPDGKTGPVMQHCGWTGVVREGIAHEPSCPCANVLKVAHRAANCKCGAIQVEQR